MEIIFNTSEALSDNIRLSNEPISYIRFLNASIDYTHINILSNGQYIGKNLPYKSFTSYLKISPGNYNIKIYPTGNKDVSIINTNIKVPPYSILTLALGDISPNFKLFSIADNIVTPSKKSFLRFANLSPKSEPLDLCFNNSNCLFKDIAFGEYTDYLELEPSTYNFNIKNNNKNLLSIPEAHLKSSKIYTLYSIGEPSKRHPLTALIPLDGSSYIKF